jgi:hypothetical protein
MPLMIDLDRAAASLGVIVDQSTRLFRHVATAWCVGPGEWVSAVGEDELPARAVLLTAVSGEQAPIEGCEYDNGVLGFKAAASAESLDVASGTDLHKRQLLRAVGYPCVIDHPAFSLSPSSLDAERYLPYLCPWVIDGHLALFSADDGWLTGRFYPGMGGAPVFGTDGRVVGMVIDGQIAPDHPALTRFRRLG